MLDWRAMLSSQCQGLVIVFLLFVIAMKPESNGTLEPEPGPAAEPTYASEPAGEPAAGTSAPSTTGSGSNTAATICVAALVLNSAQALLNA